ncbi:unnamed protein product [Trichogramma brassicae]|uniref:Uncharacterized protein n=1 Tax=Trichogramma brassicae TaxID=86971 RepID=A0A6H5J2P4_9HYME|nr:unnamed protein product [Trichogramma brassicae]
MTFAMWHTMIVARKRARPMASQQEHVCKYMTKCNGESPVSGTRQWKSCPSSRNFVTASSQPYWQAAWRNSLICVRGCRTASSSELCTPPSPATRRHRPLRPHVHDVLLCTTVTQARAHVWTRDIVLFSRSNEELCSARGAQDISAAAAALCCTEIKQSRHKCLVPHSIVARARLERCAGATFDGVKWRRRHRCIYTAVSIRLYQPFQPRTA